MLSLDIRSGEISSAALRMTFADRPYQYVISGAGFSDDRLVEREISSDGNVTVVTGLFASAHVRLTQRLRPTSDGIEETITLHNTGAQPVMLDRLQIGFCAALNARLGWRLCAIPFRVQLDGSVHDYTTQALVDGQFHNAVYTDKARIEPPLTEQGIVRSEAWAWGNGDQGLVIIKYNNQAIELSVAGPERANGETLLRFGGAGFSLYGEPSAARAIAPGADYTFGSTFYAPYQGGIAQAYQVYRDFIDARGHGFTPDYNPPVNWNELYDVGWYHSDPDKLKQFYTRAALLKEAQKAHDIGCDLLYLDPGWEVAEGTTLWDEARLGPVADFIHTLKQDYGLDLAYRTILRTYKQHWPVHDLVRHADREPGVIDYATNFPG